MKTVFPKPLTSIPGVGPRMAQDLLDLGFRSVEDLRGADPERMYNDLCRIRGRLVDRCVLYVFRCATYYASRSRHDPDLLKWWNWKDRQTPRKRP
jgi:nucleotidyltransferase/DNA polymerase involved in DNA repair